MIQAAWRTRVEFAEDRMGQEDVEVVNHSGFVAATVAAEAYRKHADAELDRGVLAHKLGQEYEGKGLAMTRAESAAKKDPRYVDFVRQLNELLEFARKADALAQYLRVRASSLLATGAAHV